MWAAFARLASGREPIAFVDGGGHLFLLDEPRNVVGSTCAFLDEE